MNHAADLSPVKPGEILGGRYRVERVLGVGGMGIVVAARHLALEQAVAIKFLLPQALLHPEVVTRFAREARAAVRIRSEHVSRVTDVGTLENGAPYMVMEYLEGRDLCSELHARGRLELDRAVDYILQACEAIAEAHRLGIVHRDLKPGNLFLVESHGVGIVKVLDFGISKISGLGGAADGGGGMTQSASLLGSPAYMSPEQMTSARSVDARSDIWALGVILFEFIAGRPPFTGRSIPELCMEITNRPAPALRSVRPDAPAGLESVVTRCLEKNRDNRYSSIDELAHALAPFAPARSRLSLERISAGAGKLQRLEPRVDTAAVEFPHGASPIPAGSAAEEKSTGRFTQPGWGRTAAEKKSRSTQWAIWAAVLAVAGTLVTLVVRQVLAPAAITEPPLARETPTSAAAAAPATVAPAAPRVEAREPTPPAPLVAPAPEAPATNSPARAGASPPAAPARPRVPAAPKPAGTAPRKVTAGPPPPAPAPKKSDGWEDDR
jgi:serine/threonine-protein kinase